MKRMILLLSILFLLTSCALFDTLIAPLYDTHVFMFRGQSQDSVKIPKGLLGDLNFLPGHCGLETWNICLLSHMDEDGVFAYGLFTACDEFRPYALVTGNSDGMKGNWIYVEGIPVSVHFVEIKKMLDDLRSKKTSMSEKAVWHVANAAAVDPPTVVDDPPTEGFAYEGELDPNRFNEWEPIYSQTTPEGLIWMYVGNPDEASPIDVVAMLIDAEFTLIGYRYFKDGEPYQYIFDASEERFKHILILPEERKSCMGCHPGKVVLREAN